MRFRPCLLASVLLLLACRHPAPAEPPAHETAEETAKRVLTTKEFPFCQPSEAAMPPWDRDWCDVQDRATSCPQIKEMCGRKWTGSFFSGGSDSARHVDGEKLGGGESGGALDRLDRMNLPALKGVGFLLWVLIGGALAVVLALVIKAILERQKTEGPAPEEEREEAPPVALELEDPGLGEVRVLLSKALAEADRDVGRALAFLYAAALRHLEDKGFIQWDITATNRHYVREIKGKTPLDRPVAELVREVERTKFGHAVPHRSVFESLYRRIVSGIPGAMVLLLLFAGLSACGDGLGSADLDGHAAFNEILMGQGIKPARLSSPIDQVTGKDPPILVDGRNLALDAAMLHSLERAMLAGSRILLLVNSKQHFPAWPFLDGKDGKSKDLQASPAWAATMQLDAKRSGILPGTRVFVLDTDERDQPDVLLQRDGDPFAVRWQSEHGELLVVADREFFSNGSMAIPENVSLALALAREVVGDRKELATAMLGPTSGAQSPGESLAQAGLLPLMLQVLLALGVLFWAKGAAFGVLRDRTVQARRSFSEHVSALGLQFARSRGSRFAASLYATYALERLWSRTGREGDRHSPATFAAAVAARAGRPEAEVHQLLEAAEQLRRQPNGIPIPERDLGVIRQLSELLNGLHLE